MVQNTIDILSSINVTVKKIAETMKPKNDIGKDVTAKLAKGDLGNTSDIRPSNDKLKVDISGDGLGEFISFLNNLSPSITEISKLSKSKVNSFKKTIELLSDSVSVISDTMNKNSDAISNAEKLSKVISVITSSINKMPKLAVTAPTASIGLMLAKPVVKLMISLLNTVNGVNDIDKKIKKLNGLSGVIDPIMTLAFKATALVGVCFGLGMLLTVGDTKSTILNGFIALGGVLVAVTALVGVIGLASRVIKNTDALKNTNEIIKLAGAAVLLVAACYGIGYAIEKLGGMSSIMKGLGAVALSLGLLTGVLIAISYASKATKDAKVMTSIGSILVLTAGAMGLIIASKYIGDFALNNILSIITGLGAVALVMGALIGLSVLASRFLNNSVQAMIGIGLMEVLVLGAMGLLVLSSILADYLEGKYVGIATTFVMVLGLIGIVGAIAYAAGAVAEYIGIGVVALFAIELVIAGMFGVLYLAYGLVEKMIDFHDLMDQRGLTWSDLVHDVLGFGSVLKTFGLIAMGEAVIGGLQLFGDVVIGITAIVIDGLIDMTKRLINLRDIMSNNNVTWVDLKDDVVEIGGVITAFGDVIKKFGLVDTILNGLKSLAMEPLILFAGGITGIAKKFIDLHTIKIRSGYEWNEVSEDIEGVSKILSGLRGISGKVTLVGALLSAATPMMLNVSAFTTQLGLFFKTLVMTRKNVENGGGSDALVSFINNDVNKIMDTVNMDNFGVDLSLKELKELVRKYKVISELVSSVSSVAKAISDIAQLVGIVDNQGNIRRILSIDKETGEITYSEAYSLANVAVSVTSAIRAFVENSKYGLEDVRNMYRSQKVYEILGQVIDPVSKFVEMITGYVGNSDDQNPMLAPVRIDSEGNVTIGEYVSVIKVAGTIAGAVSKFIDELYSDQYTQHWAEVMYGDRTFFEKLFGGTGKKAQSVKEAVGVLGLVVEPLSKFMDVISCLDSPKEGILRKIVVDAEGNIKPGPEINVSDVAASIATLITSFVTNVYNDDMFNKSSKYTDKDFDKLFKPVTMMVGIAEKLSSDKLKADTITDNAQAIHDANWILLNAIGNQDINKMNDTIPQLDKLVSIGINIGNKVRSELIMSNSKAIVSFMTDVVDKKFPESGKVIDDFSDKMERLTKSFMDLDDVLKNEEDQRLRSLDAFEEKVTSLIEKLKDGQISMQTFNDMFSNASSYGQPQPQQPIPFGITPAPTNNVTSGLTKEEIQSAIEDAIYRKFNNSRISPSGTASLDNDNQLDDWVVMLK